MWIVFNVKKFPDLRYAKQTNHNNCVKHWVSINQEVILMIKYSYHTRHYIIGWDKSTWWCHFVPSSSLRNKKTTSSCALAGTVRLLVSVLVLNSISACVNVPLWNKLLFMMHMVFLGSSWRYIEQPCFHIAALGTLGCVGCVSENLASLCLAAQVHVTMPTKL